ncbi:MAG: dTMP kinase [Venatoribacter sp.]
MRSGRFITFEGGEGVGKSTNIQFCAKWLQEHGVKVVTTREPGGTVIAELIREKLLKAHHDEPMDAQAELLLMFAARAQHLNQRIRPELALGTWVLCDRFTDSTIAYQGFGRGLPLAQIEQLKDLVQQGLEPDCTFLLEAPIELGMARARARANLGVQEIDRFETEQLAFFQRVQQGFNELANNNPRIRRIDASGPLAKVQAQLSLSLEELLRA